MQFSSGLHISMLFSSSVHMILSLNQNMEPIWHKLPAVLWPIVGEYIFMDIEPHGKTIKLTVKPAVCYLITWPKDEPGESFVEPCTSCAIS